MAQRFFINPSIDPAKASAETIFRILNPKVGACDFGNSFVIAPTKNAARLIAENFSAICMERERCGTAGLRIATPHVMLEAACNPKARANTFECLGALKQVLETIDEHNFPNLFPQGKENINSLSLAKTLRKLRALASEAGHSFASVSKISSQFKIADANKWEELAEVEERYLAELSKISKHDADDMLAEASHSPAPNFAPEQIILAGAPDLPQIFIRLLETLEARGSKISVLIISSEENSFDKWGLPLSSWHEKPLGISDGQITLCADIRDQARTVATEISKLGNAAPTQASIACDEETTMRFMRAELAAEGFPIFSPTGEKFSEGDVFTFLNALKNYYADPDGKASFALFRDYIFTMFISKRSGMPTKEIRSMADEYNSENLCSNMRDALTLSKSGTVEQRVFLEANYLLEPDETMPSKIFEKIFFRGLNTISSNSPTFEDACNSVAEALKLMRVAEKSGFVFNLSDAIQILTECADKEVFSETREQNAICALNWIEIFWAKEPNIFIADFNDGKVPEQIFGDAFMPDSLRTKLGIRNSAFRHSRDAAMLHSLAESRRNSGALKIFLPKTDKNAEPLRPSRLLLQNPPNILSRVKLLFAEKNSDKRASAFEKSWNLKIHPAETPEYLSVTDFKAYIECPFRFYLERILKARAFAQSKEELDAMQIGSAVHDAFFQTSKTETLDAEEIFASLEKEFRKSLKKTFGATLPAAAMLQTESIVSRLRAASFVEANHRQNGWKTLSLEESFEPLEISGFKVKSRIDRIDAHPDGTYLIIDYKTSDSFETRKGASNAEAAHLKARKIEGELVWKDLQLPLYREAATKRYATENIACAYFTLPKKTEETSLDPWFIDAYTQKSAIKCAENIAEQIHLKNFTPSENTPLVKYYPELFGWADAKMLKNFVEIQL